MASFFEEGPTLPLLMPSSSSFSLVVAPRADASPMCRITKPSPRRRRLRAVSPPVAGSSGGSGSGSGSSSPRLPSERSEPTSMAVARMAREEAERSHLARHIEELKSASEGERRRVRRAARERGRAAYVRALEHTVTTNEAEKSTLQALLASCTRDRQVLFNTLQSARQQRSYFP